MVPLTSWNILPMLSRGYFSRIYELMLLSWLLAQECCPTNLLWKHISKKHFECYGCVNTDQTIFEQNWIFYNIFPKKNWHNKHSSEISTCHYHTWTHNLDISIYGHYKSEHHPQFDNGHLQGANTPLHAVLISYRPKCFRDMGCSSSSSARIPSKRPHEGKNNGTSSWTRLSFPRLKSLIPTGKWYNS